MKPGRNEPCPCGSGMKYKKCCYSKEQSISVGNTVNSQSVQGNPQDSLEDQELLLGLMNTFRTMILDKKPHIKEYYKTRKFTCRDCQLCKRPYTTPQKELHSNGGTC